MVSAGAPPAQPARGGPCTWSTWRSQCRTPSSLEFQVTVDNITDKITVTPRRMLTVMRSTVYCTIFFIVIALQKSPVAGKNPGTYP